MRVVMVTWHDAASHDSWVDIATESEMLIDHFTNALSCTYGEVVYECDEFVCVAGTTNSYNQACCVMIIPRVSISSIVELSPIDAPPHQTQR